LCNEEIPRPEGKPGKNKKKDPQLEAEEDVDDGQGSAHCLDRDINLESGRGSSIRVGLPAEAGFSARLLLEGTYLLGDVAEIDILAINLGEFLQSRPCVTRLFVRHSQVILQRQD